MARVAYQSSNILRTTAAFAFDRYICGSTSSADRRRGTDNNKISANSAANRLYNKVQPKPEPGNLELLNSCKRISLSWFMYLILAIVLIIY